MTIIKIEIIIWNHIIINIRSEYLKPVCKLFVLDRNIWYLVTVCKKILTEKFFKSSINTIL